LKTIRFVGVKKPVQRLRQKLEIVSWFFQGWVDLKRHSIVSDGPFFVANRLIGPAQVAMSKG
jgi:hypothetical protein